jgi:glycosyltransferase involved in cell wall biosynthesis
LELARALAEAVDCELVTFDPQARSYRDPSGLQVHILRPLAYLHSHPAHPLAPALLMAVKGANIVHSHHMRSTPSRLVVLSAHIRGQPMVTDHGLQGSNWAGFLPRLFDRFLAVSIYSARELGAPLARTRIIYGGTDPHRFVPDPLAKRHGVLFIGRITPHKGTDRLIAVLPAGAHLLIAGSTGHDHKPPERDYPLLLQQLARDRNVNFLGPVPEERLSSLYQQAILRLGRVDRSRALNRW